MIPTFLKVRVFSPDILEVLLKLTGFLGFGEGRKETTETLIFLPWISCLFWHVGVVCFSGNDCTNSTLGVYRTQHSHVYVAWTRSIAFLSAGHSPTAAGFRCHSTKLLCSFIKIDLLVLSLSRWHCMGLIYGFKSFPMVTVLIEGFWTADKCPYFKAEFCSFLFFEPLLASFQECSEVH